MFMATAIVKAMNGGNNKILAAICFGLAPPFAKIAAVIKPSVAITTKVPGWSTIIAVFKPSSP